MLSDQIAANKRRALVFVGAIGLVVVLLPALLLVALGLPVAALLVALVVVAALAFTSRSGDAIALRRTGAVPAEAGTEARLHNLVDGLCAAGGLPRPRVYVIEDPAPNAFSIGRDPHHASIVVTRGLLDGLNRIELEGVLAHELSHVKNYDTLVATLAVALLGPLPGGASLVGRIVPPRREAVADQSGVSLTRYPPGLIAALEKLRADGRAVTAASPGVVAPLWIESPVTAPDALALDERIEALREL